MLTSPAFGSAGAVVGFHMAALDSAIVQLQVEEPVVAGVQDPEPVGLAAPP